MGKELAPPLGKDLDQLVGKEQAPSVGGANTCVRMAAVSASGVSGGPGGCSEDAESDALVMAGVGACARGTTLTMTSSSVGTPSAGVRTAVMTTGTMSLCRAT